MKNFEPVQVSEIEAVACGNSIVVVVFVVREVVGDVVALVVATVALVNLKEIYLSGLRFSLRMESPNMCFYLQTRGQMRRLRVKEITR